MQSTVEACSLPTASFLFMSRRCGRSAGYQWGIRHARVIWALCLDTVHEGQAYLWRAHCETATGQRRGGVEWVERGRGGGLLLNGFFMETACVLQCIHTSMKQRGEAWQWQLTSTRLKVCSSRTTASPSVIWHFFKVKNPCESSRKLFSAATCTHSFSSVQPRGVFYGTVIGYTIVFVQTAPSTAYCTCLSLQRPLLSFTSSPQRQFLNPV